MANPVANKRMGATFELDIVKWFRGLGFNAERLRLSGKDDEGDRKSTRLNSSHT